MYYMCCSCIITGNVILRYFFCCTLCTPVKIYIFAKCETDNVPIYSTRFPAPFVPMIKYCCIFTGIYSLCWYDYIVYCAWWEAMKLFWILNLEWRKSTDHLWIPHTNMQHWGALVYVSFVVILNKFTIYRHWLSRIGGIMLRRLVDYCPAFRVPMIFRNISAYVPNRFYRSTFENEYREWTKWRISLTLHFIIWSQLRHAWGCAI